MALPLSYALRSPKARNRKDIRQRVACPLEHKVFNAMADWISNTVTALNDAAKDFTRKHVVDEEGNFCFGKLVPVPDIITKNQRPMNIVSPEELQAFKDAHPKTVHCEYEQEGLLYTLDEDGDVYQSVCTKACHERLIELYGCDNDYVYCIKFWGSRDEIGECETEDEDDTLSYYFSTAWDLPWQFMRKLTTACPEGKWEWCCDAEGYFDWLKIELHQGKVIITKHCLPDDILELWQDIYGDEDFDLNQVCKWDDFGDTLMQYEDELYLETELDPEDEVYQVELYQEVVIADYSRK